MKCFSHPATDAIASCKHCFKGVCPQCARDTGIGVVCSPACEEEVRSIRAMVERNRKAYPLAARSQSRNAIWFTALALVLIVFGIIAHRGFMSNYLIVFGILMLLGAAFSALTARRMSKL
jgi:hypothetical protein